MQRKKIKSINNVKKHKLWDEDVILFASIVGKYQSENEERFFKNMQNKEEYEPTALNDLIVSENENKDEIYMVRMYNEEYVIGHGVGSDGANEVHAMCLSEALALNLKLLGFIERNLTLWQWLRECDYSVVNYKRNYDILNKKKYVRQDQTGRWFNAKYPPDFKKNGDKYDGYKTGNEEVLFYDFAVMGYDMSFSYKGKSFFFLSEPDYVALCDEHFTKEYQRFDDGNTALEQFLIDGKPLIKLVNELEDVEPY